MLSPYRIPRKQRRKGVVLLATMVVVVLLSLTAYHFSDHALHELKASDSTHRKAQARAIADSGIHYAAAWLCNYVAMSGGGQGGQQGGGSGGGGSGGGGSGGGGSGGQGGQSGGANQSNPYHEPDLFQSIPVQSDKKGYSGRFMFIAPVDPGQNYPPSNVSNDNRVGFSDETGKINLNAFMLINNTGNGPPIGQQMLLNMLLNLNLPGMDENVALSIMDWLDYDTMPLPGGTETYGNSVTARQGPLDGIEELNLAQNVTPTLIYGNDRNRNGKFDAGDDDTQGSSYMPGLWDLTTTYSRELLVMPNGQPMIWLNDSYANLNSGAAVESLGQEVVNYVLMARLYNLQPVATLTGSGAPAATSYKTGNLSSPAPTDLPSTATFQPNISSIWQLVDTYVMVPPAASSSGSGAGSGGGGGKGGGGKGGGMGNGSGTQSATQSTMYMSPLLSAGNNPAIFNQVFLYSTPWPYNPAGQGGGGGGGGGGNSGNSGNSGSGNSNSGSSSATSSAATISSWTGPPLIMVPWERPARININTCNPIVLNALLNSVPPPTNNSNSGSGTAASSGAGSSSASSTAATPASYLNTILANRPVLSQSGAVDPQFLTPAWLLTTAQVPVPVLLQLDPYITTTSQVFRVQSVGVLDGPDGTAARIEAVIDTNAGMPRILAWRELSDLGKGVDTRVSGK